MVMSCRDPLGFVKHIEIAYPDAIRSAANAVGAQQFVFPDGLVINIYPKGTIHFQGKLTAIRAKLEAQIVILNRR